MKKDLMKELVMGKKSKSNGFVRLFPKPSSIKARKNPTYLTPKRTDNILGNMFPNMHMTSSQKMYMKTHKGTQRFMDNDGDGVPNGLDCEYRNPKKHGTVRRFRNLWLGYGFRDDEPVSPQPQPDPQPQPEQIVEQIKKPTIPKKQPKPIPILRLDPFREKLKPKKVGYDPLGRKYVFKDRSNYFSTIEGQGFFPRKRRNAFQ